MKHEGVGMREFFAAVGTEVFRPLVTLLIPGSIAALPLVATVLSSDSYVAQLAAKYPTERTLTVLLVVVFVGMVIEDVGSRIESYFDRLRGDSHSAAWNRYLRLAFRIEPVGHRYLRTIVLRLKFELGSAVALVLAATQWVGIAWGHAYSPTCWAMVLGSALVIAGYLVREAWSSHRLLGELRRNLLKGVEEIPSSNKAIPVRPDGT
jgi:hypothetical protein